MIVFSAYGFLFILNFTQLCTAELQ